MAHDSITVLTLMELHILDGIVKDHGHTVKMCEIIQGHLNLTGRRIYYDFPKKNDGNVFARFHFCDLGTSLNFTFYPLFFTQSLENQLSVIIHEHLHGIGTPAVQAWNSFAEFMPEPQRSYYLRAATIADETITCHLEGVLFTLLRPLCQSLLTN